MLTNYNDTICALSTPNGMGAIAVIRVSGSEAFFIVEKIFSKKLSDKQSHTVHFGTINYQNSLIDEVLVTVFKNPHSFTGEDTIEISCHGSIFIQQKILETLILNGARLAKPGEFSIRAFHHKKFDLAQAEAISDLIYSETEASHRLAIQQMRGGISKEIGLLRQELLHFVSLVELELDFSEEDVEFADRKKLKNLINQIEQKLTGLVSSFSYGNAIKKGVPISIIGAPNTGKSTLLNQLLKEDKAIVSEIAGTTRDLVEDEIIINGIVFRFIDTAGIRDSDDKVEQIGIKKAIEKAQLSTIVIYLFDVTGDITHISKLRTQLEKQTKAIIVSVGNKIDLINTPPHLPFSYIPITAKNNKNITELTTQITHIVNAQKTTNQNIVITNLRHYESLKKALEAIRQTKKGLNAQITGDFLALDIRQALYYLGEITGEITNDEVLGAIFGKFCIGK